MKPLPGGSHNIGKVYLTVGCDGTDSYVTGQNVAPLTPYLVKSRSNYNRRTPYLCVRVPMHFTVECIIRIDNINMQSRVSPDCACFQTHIYALVIVRHKKMA